MALADRIGIEPFTIRKLAAELDVKPMTIYHHVAGREAIIDGIVDAVFAEIELPPPTWTGGRRSGGAAPPPGRCWPATPGRRR